jgi:hypothetical protein
MEGVTEQTLYETQMVIGVGVNELGPIIDEDLII